MLLPCLPQRFLFLLFALFPRKQAGKGALLEFRIPHHPFQAVNLKTKLLPAVFAAKLSLYASQKVFPAALARFQFNQRHHHTSPTSICANLPLPCTSLCYSVCLLALPAACLVCVGAGLGDEVCVSLPSTVCFPYNFSLPKTLLWHQLSPEIR